MKMNILKINSISNAKSRYIFFSNIKYLDRIKLTKAKACLIKKDYKLPSKKCKPIIVKEPYLAFAMLTNLFNKKR